MTGEGLSWFMKENEEMAQWVKVLEAKPDDLSSSPKMHMVECKK